MSQVRALAQTLYFTGEVIVSYNCYKLEQMDRCLHELWNRSPFLST